MFLIFKDIWILYTSLIKQIDMHIYVHLPKFTNRPLCSFPVPFVLRFNPAENHLLCSYTRHSNLLALFPISLYAKSQSVFLKFGCNNLN